MCAATHAFIALVIFCVQFEQRKAAPSQIQRLRPRIVPDFPTLTGLSAPMAAPSRTYNATYPLSEPVKNEDGSTEFRVAIISDQDKRSKRTTGASTWISYIKTGTLVLNSDWSSASMTWDVNATVTDNSILEDRTSAEYVEAGQPILSQFAFGNRGMELSDIVVFDGRLLALEDRTGIVFELLDGEAVPWVILADGNGKKQKGFKCEWSVVKDEHLYVGSHSADIKFPHPDGPSVQAGQRWVKKISKEGLVEHLDWNSNFTALEKHLGLAPPGYMMIEAVLWSEKRKSWHILPRQISAENYTEERHPYTCSNLMITIDQEFKQFEDLNVGPHSPLFGFSAARFVPGTDDNIVIALRILEIEETFSTHIVVFNINGQILMEEKSVLDGLKYEGIEFV